jgi:hypothetical protein
MSHGRAELRTCQSAVTSNKCVRQEARLGVHPGGPRRRAMRTAILSADPMVDGGKMLFFVLASLLSL